MFFCFIYFSWILNSKWCFKGCSLVKVDFFINFLNLAWKNLYFEIKGKKYIFPKSQPAFGCQPGFKSSTLTFVDPLLLCIFFSFVIEKGVNTLKKYDFNQSTVLEAHIHWPKHRGPPTPQSGCQVLGSHGMVYYLAPNTEE